MAVPTISWYIAVVPYEPPSEPPERRPLSLSPQDRVIAWEDENRGFLGRFFATLGSTFTPSLSAAAAARGRFTPSFTFALLSLFPSMLLWGIIPLTRSITFKQGFATELAKGTTDAALQMDMLRAAGLGFALSLFGFLSWTLPFASLAGAFAADAQESTNGKLAAWRTALYRGWVVPFGMLAAYVLMWMLPAVTPEGVQLVLIVMLQMFPRLLLVVHSHALARQVGASYLAALAIALVPLLVEWAAGSLMWNYAQSLLPPMPEQH